MKKDIILAGVGGQGILSIATVIGEAAMAEGWNIKQAEVHGMSQRGGDVQSNLRLSTEPIASDLIAKGGADIIISLEPMEALRYLPYLKKDGWIVTNNVPFVNIGGAYILPGPGCRTMDYYCINFFRVHCSASFFASSNDIPIWSSNLNFINRRNQRNNGWSDMTAAFSRNDQNSTPQQNAVK